MIIEIRSIGGLKICNASGVISLSYIKCDKLLFVVLLILISTISSSNSLDQLDRQSKQQSYGGQFVGEEEADAIAPEANIRLAKIPCNFTTKTNCIFAEQKLSLSIKDFLQQHSQQETGNEIVVTWMPQVGVTNTTENSFKPNINSSTKRNIKNNNSSSIHNVREKPRSGDFYNFNWIFELLACMMLASAFEICLLVLRNLRNISLAFFGFWSAFNTSLQNLCGSCSTTTTTLSSNKTDPQRNRNVANGEKRTLSYIFAILTWRASRTAKNGITTEETLRDDSNPNAINYGHVTTVGDLLLLILFTHVYYQRQRLQQIVENEINAADPPNPDPENLMKVDDNNNNKDKEKNSRANQKFYDAKRNNSNNNNVFSESSSPMHRRGVAGGSNKRCSHFCGNMYQQISSLQQEERKWPPNKLVTATKIPPYLTHCTSFMWCTCCFCQYSCRLCCYCCTNCCRWNHRCSIYIPLCNTIYCCCFYKSFNSVYDANNQYCCYLCCWEDVCHLSKLSSSHANTYHCCRCLFYCCFCNSSTTTTNKTPVRTVNRFLLTKTSNSNNYWGWELIWNNQNYTILRQIDGQSYSLLHVKDAKSNFLYKRSSSSYYQFAVDAFNCLLPQYLLNMKNCQTLLKWKRMHVAIVVVALIVICASRGGCANCNHHHHHYYSSLLKRCNKHFFKCQQNKRRRKRRRRRYQYCMAYRPQHYFYTALMQCVKRQKTKKLPKNFVDKLHEKSPKLLTTAATTTQNNEQSLAAATVISTKTTMVRAIRRVRGSKPNIVWLLIGLIWFEGPKIVNCNIIINYQNQQQPEQQQQQKHQQQAGNNAQKEATTNTVNSNFDYKIENFNQMKTKNSNNNSNNNNNNNNSNNNNNKNKHKNNSNGNNSNSNSTNNSNRSPPTSSNNNNSSRTSSSSNNIRLSVNAIPIINTIHMKHYCNSNYHQKLIRSTQRVQRALKTNSNLDTSITSSASLSYKNFNDDLDSDLSSAFQTINEESNAQSDLMRLESIKHQILFKLGLTRKPNVSHPLPKQFIWDTIYRADGIRSFHEFSNTNNFQDHQHFNPQQNYPYWWRTPIKSAIVVPVNVHQQRQQNEYSTQDSNDSDDVADNIKRSLKSINVVRKKFSKNRQQLQQHQTHSKPFKNNNDIMYRKGATTSTTKKLNELLYTTTTTNRNKLINHTNKTVNNFTILKQSKHQQFYKNSPHSTITSAKNPITTHQQHTNNSNNKNSIKNNNNNNNNNSNNNKSNNNNNNDVNNSNNKNSNNIIMVQTHLRNNNKYIEEEKKFTYLTDINSSDDSLNIMEEQKSPDSDDNNSILRKPNHHHQHHNHHNDHDRTNVQPLHMPQKHEKITQNHQQLNIDDVDDGIVDVDGNVNVKPEAVHENDEAESDDGEEHDRYFRYGEHQHQHDNYFSKLETFEENEDFFGSTQEIITFAEKGKMYKNHRLVEFSHQSSEKSKENLHVRYAEIHIRIDKISLKNKSRAGSGIKRKRLKIWIFQLIENNYTYKGFDHVAQFCASFEVDTSRLGWKKFDITPTVKEWYSRREGEKLRLLIDCTGCGKLYSVHLFSGSSARGEFRIGEHRMANEKRNANNVKDANSKNFYNVTHNNDDLTKMQYNETFVVTDHENSRRRNSKNIDNKRDDEDELNSNRPFLVLYTEAKRQKRVRRRAINCNGALHGQCCKESFYVSFKALGWDDWIIAPRGYFANYCRGDCTGPYRTPDTFQTFHAHFIEEYRKMGLLNGMQPCCAPIKFSSMSLIYYGDEGIIKRDLPKMVVDECGCP